MKFFSLLWAAPAATLAFGNPAHSASLITFDDINPNPCCYFPTSYVSNGMIFTSPSNFIGFGQLFFPPDVNPSGYSNIDPGGASILGEPLVMRVDGQGTFDFFGFTFGLRAENNPLTSGFIQLRFQYDNGRDEIETFNTDTFGPKNVTLARYGLRGVNWLRGAVYYNVSNCNVCNHTGGSIGPFVVDDVVVDNVTISPDPVPLPIPEPATWLLLTLGFGGVGVIMRRDRKRTDHFWN